MVVMAVLLAVLFIGVTFIADAFQIVPSEEGSGGPTLSSAARGADRLRSRYALCTTCSKC